MNRSPSQSLLGWGAGAALLVDRVARFPSVHKASRQSFPLASVSSRVHALIIGVDVRHGEKIGDQ